MSHLYDLALAFAKRKGGKPGYYRAYPNPTTTWKDGCGALTNQFELYIGGWSKAPALYGPSASDVMRASGWLNKNHREAPVNAIHWFTIAGSIHGHVMVDLNGGGTDCLSASGRASKRKLAPYLVIQSVPGYIATGGVTYEGWSTNYGGGLSRYVEPKPAAPEPDQRQVLASASVNLRAEPTSLAEKRGSAPAGAILTFTGWRHGQAVSGVDVWFTAGNGWFWAGGFTDRGTHDLTDLNEPEPAEEPTEPTPVEPDPPIEPEPAEPTPDTEEEPMPQPPITPPDNATTAPAVPEDVIVPRNIRGPLLLGSWIVGSVLGAANVGWIYAIQQGVADYPVWLGIGTAVFGFVSAQVNAIARANLNPPKL